MFWQDWSKVSSCCWLLLVVVVVEGDKRSASLIRRVKSRAVGLRISVLLFRLGVEGVEREEEREEE